MGILKRFGAIMSANINALLDKAEDPGKMVDQTLRELREDLAEVKKETASVMAEEERCKRLVDECDAEIAKYSTAARNAVAAGEDEDARKILARKQELESKKTSLAQAYEAAALNADKMRQMFNKLTSDIESLESRKEAIKAKVAVAKAQQKVNEMSSGIDSASSIAAFERMEEKANKMLDTANAEAELNAKPSTDDLADKYASGGNASVDAELEALKAELAGGL